MACYLPSQIVVDILRHVEQKERLTVCSRVCRSWAAAAAAATNTVQLWLAHVTAAERCSRVDGLSTWLQHHPRQVLCLHVHGNYMSRPQLFLPAETLLHLQQLDLAHCKVSILQGDASSNTGRPPASCTHVVSDTEQQQLLLQQQHCTRRQPWPGQQECCAPSCFKQSPDAPSAGFYSLQLRSCVLDWRYGLPSAVSLQNLKQLCLQQLLPAELSKQQQHVLQQQAPTVFRQLTALTQLVLKQLYQYEEALLAGLAAGLGSMHHLLDLQVDMLQLTAAALTALPNSLTLLELAGAKQLMLSSCAVPGLTTLSHLQHLRVEGVRRFEPRILGCFPKLRGLRLRSSSSRFLPDGFQGTRDLLSALQGLPDLQALDVRNVLQHVLPDELLQAYSGLTASQQLTQLDLSACRFPPRCGALLFQEGCSLPGLQQLVLYRCEDPGGSALHLDNLRGLVQGCPALQDLSLWLSSSSSSSDDDVRADGSRSSRHGGSSSGWPFAGHPLQAVTSLSGLTRLVVAGPGVTDAAAAVIVQLTQLSSLALFRCRQLTDGAIWSLSQLTQLTTLVVDVPQRGGAAQQPGEYMLLQGPLSSRAAGQDSCQQDNLQAEGDIPVWQQLQRLHLAAHAAPDAAAACQP